jgi:ABC-type Fe3+-hydroxamate transport system substrate-binding protein
VASATGDESNVNDYIQTDIEGKIAAAKVTNSPTVAFLMPGEGSEHMIDGTNSFLGDMLKRIGAKPMGPDGNRFVTLNVEDLIKDNPDVIMVAGDPHQIANDPRLASLKAVKSKNVYGINPDIALREGARVPDLATGMGEILNRAAKS